MEKTVTHEVFRGTVRFSSLDAFRTCGVLAVIWHHTAGDGWNGIGARGALGVDFFFVISGFLITTLLLREHDRNGHISLLNFYIRRTLRIFPLYYLVLLVYVALVAATELDSAEGQTFVDNLPSFLTYTSNWFVDLDSSQNSTFYFAWSLATEEQFYLLWPPVLVLLLASARRWTVPTFIVLGGLVAIDQVATLEHPSAGLGRTILASIATPILLGVAGAVVTHRRTTFNVIARMIGHRWSNAVILALTVLSLQIGVPDEAVAVMFALLVVASCIREDTVLHPLLRWRPLVFVGVISYGVYLMHMLAANMVRVPLGHDYGIDVFGATVPVVVCAAALSHRFFEVPITRLGSRSSANSAPDNGAARPVPGASELLGVDPLKL